MAIETWLTAVAGVAAGGTAAWFVFVARERALRAEAAARFEADARDSRARAEAEAEQRVADRHRQLAAEEQRLREREDVVHRQLDRLGAFEAELRSRAENVSAAEETVDALRKDAEALRLEWIGQLETVAGASVESARESVLQEAKARAARDAAEISRSVVEQARSTADDEARRIISIAIQRYEIGRAHV